MASDSLILWQPASTAPSLQLLLICNDRYLDLGWIDHQGFWRWHTAKSFKPPEYWMQLGWVDLETVSALRIR
jgi:hypothetical protein